MERVRNFLMIFMIILLPSFAYAEGFNWGEALSPGGLIAGAVVMVVELIMGKTDWFKSGSILEFVGKLLLKIFKKDTEL